MKKNIYTDKDIKYRKILSYITNESLKMTKASEALLVYGTNHTLKMHLPINIWDRSTIYKNTGPVLFGLVAKFKALIARIGKIIPIRHYTVQDGQKIENYGIIAFLFNRHEYFYKMGITVLLVPDVQKYMMNTKENFKEIPIYSYDGLTISRFSEDLKVDLRITRIAKSRNFISLLIPHFGVLELNNCEPLFFDFEHDLLIKEKLNQLISMVNRASLAYYHQKGKYITETQRLEELLEKEEKLREMGVSLRLGQKDLERHVNALNKVEKERYELELQRDQLSREVVKAQETIKEIQQETDASMATISHTVKNLYMAQKSLAGLVSDNVLLQEGQINQLLKIITAATSKYPKLNNYEFWKIMQNNINIIKMNSKSAMYANRRSNDHMIQILEYILAVLAFQRGKDYEAEGRYYADLLKILRHIKTVHDDRLASLGISFEYQNKSGDTSVLVNNIYHFYLEEDIFLNLLINSIQNFPEQHEKKIWVEIYSEKTTSGSQYYEIHYRDNGRGIPQDKKEAIFGGWTSKQETDLSITDNKTEHGIGGKTIHKRIVNAGGSIKEIGIPGEGAHFVIKLEKYIELPEEEFNINEDVYIQPDAGESEESAEAGQAPGLESYLSGKSILIIDDDERIQRYMASIFKGMLTPYYATGQEDAWNIIYSNTPPDVITLDLDLLSTEKGENLLFDFKMRGISNRIPVIIVSGADRVFEVDKLTKLGAVAVFQKPIKEAELRSTVFGLLSKNSGQKQARE